MGILDIIWSRLLALAQHAREDERGELINWVVLAIGLATAAAAVIAILKPALTEAANKIVSILSG